MTQARDLPELTYNTKTGAYDHASEWLPYLDEFKKRALLIAIRNKWQFPAIYADNIIEQLNKMSAALVQLNYPNQNYNTQLPLLVQITNSYEFLDLKFGEKTDSELQTYFSSLECLYKNILELQLRFYEDVSRRERTEDEIKESATMQAERDRRLIEIRPLPLTFRQQLWQHIVNFIKKIFCCFFTIEATEPAAIPAPLVASPPELKVQTEGPSRLSTTTTIVQEVKKQKPVEKRVEEVKMDALFKPLEQELEKKPTPMAHKKPVAKRAEPRPSYIPTHPRF